MIESIHNQCISMSAASRNTPCGSRKGIHMEIERKYLVKILPDHLEQYPCRQIEQGYLSTNPVVRIRRSNDRYILTYKGKGLMVREEYNLPLNEESFTHLKEKIDGLLIQKRRYLIPLAEKYTIELDVFEGALAPLVLAEVEFETEEEANTFVSTSPRYRLRTAAGTIALAASDPPFFTARIRRFFGVWAKSTNSSTCVL